MAQRNDFKRQSVGLSGIQQQVFRKVTKKGFDFNLMVAGEAGLGKSTLIETLFMQKDEEPHIVPAASERIERTVKISPRTKVIGDNGVNLNLTVIDTPGFSDAVDNTNWCIEAVGRLCTQGPARQGALVACACIHCG
ncbi:septin 2 [Salpingoeca rosetta]|uniref:Septin 2 n=1 Tax=Salpingoeca rosetta (strain ATCC 50818 / BSB-021) TaxID=946362 RepID=F2U8C1_SALR5|nr:septin 2 [Salpingoeca rosetta]EGD72629.1 septin 2 [Salpingoeca rosetta]|eukprot:XP_004994452.1 septin 2 [Salpingoeca rosetta]